MKYYLYTNTFMEILKKLNRKDGLYNNEVGGIKMYRVVEEFVNSFKEELEEDHKNGVITDRKYIDLISEISGVLQCCERISNDDIARAIDSLNSFRTAYMIMR